MFWSKLLKKPKTSYKSAISVYLFMSLRLFVFIFLLSLDCIASHNRAGYISYTRVGNTGYTYHFKIYTYTNPVMTGPDNCVETLIFTNIGAPGSTNYTLTCQRTNSDPIDLSVLNPPLATSSCGSFGGSIPGQGHILIYPFPANTAFPTYGGIKVNIYEGNYTFNGASSYVFGMIDPNLDANVNNINGGHGNSSSVAFALLDTLNVTNISNYNNTPLVTNPPIDNACYHQPFCYNPGMQDPDNDSLSYSLMPFITGNSSGNTGNFYNALNSTIPLGISVNPLTGELCWTSQFNNFADQNYGEYDIDMLVKEYRRNPIDGSRYQVGSLVFSIQIYVVPCAIPPISITNPPNTCVEAGSSMNPISVTASDPSPVGGLHITASGVGLTSPNIGSNASFPNNSGTTSVTGTLNWLPSCEAVSLSPYYFTVRGYDDNTPLANAAYSTIVVQVVSPPVQNLCTAIVGDSVQLTWLPPAGCSSSITNTKNPIIEYLIYRTNDCISYTPTPWKTGVPASSGYQLVATCTASPYYDTNNGQGLPPGNTYSYLVIAKFADGSLSMAPNHTNCMCITLHLGIPILTHVSVDTTDRIKGEIFVRWHKPLTTNSNFDTTLTANKGPYYFVLQRKQYSVHTGTYTPYTTIYTTPARAYFGLLANLSDTTFTDSTINTVDNQFFYKVLFYANNLYKGAGAPASSIYAAAVGHDKKAVISWNTQTPWQDTLYYVFRQNYNNNAYTLIDSTHNTTDTIKHLTNKYNYCFKILSVGSYKNPNIISPLLNFSQKICVTPIDDSPPCQPKLSIAGDCNAAINKLTWTNPDHSCNINDVLKYYIYYTPKQDSTLSKIDSILNVKDTSYTTNYNANNIAGCYVIVAVDSAGNQSPLINESCTDNCPEYELPNIFTPNADNVNDLYIPVKNKFIRSVDFILYNRWGEIVYENSDPKLGWDGKSKQLNKPVPDGIYFYTCTVYEIHYYGIKETKLKGFVQLLK